MRGGLWGGEDGWSGYGPNDGLKSIRELTDRYYRTICGWETAVEGAGGRPHMRRGLSGVRMGV